MLNNVRNEISKTSATNGVNSDSNNNRANGNKSRRSNSIVGNLLSARSSSASGRSSLASRAKNVISSGRRLVAAQQHSSGGSLSSSTDQSTCSTTNTNSASAFPRQSTGHSNTLKFGSLSQCSGRYYGFSALNLSPWDDNARQSSDLTEDEEAAVNALELATSGSHIGVGDLDDYDDEVDGQHHGDNDHDDDDEIGNDDNADDDDDYGHYGTLRSAASNDRRISTLRDCLASGLDVEDNGMENGYKNGASCKASGEKQIADEIRTDSTTRQTRSFEQAITSGYLNYGFYSFSLARFLDDQALVTDYLSLVSSSSGASYYLDLEFKLKQRHQSPAISGAYLAAPSLSSSVTTLSGVHLDVINRGQLFEPQTTRLVHSTNRLSSLSFASKSTSTINNSNTRTIISSNSKIADDDTRSLSASQNFANNMIARLSAGGGSTTASQRGVAQPSSGQSKRKRAKLLELLLNTNWSKQRQQPSNLIKLNEALKACDANFVDEKTGESPLSLAINSQQIYLASIGGGNNKNGNGGFSQSASLFNLQCQSTSTNMNQFTLQQTSISDLSQSTAPLVERILLLLIKSGALIDFRNSDGRTPLHIAAMKSNIWALKTLLDLGASTNYRDINGLTPLYYSVMHKADLNITQLLLNHNRNSLASVYQMQNQRSNATGNDCANLSSIGTTDQHGWQEVHQACKLGLDAHLEKLLYYGCDINAKISGSGNTPLHVAAINDQLDCAKILLLRGADKTITNNSHQTAHQVAVISNNMDLAEFIAEHDETRVVPFRDRPPNYVDMSRTTLSSTTTLPAPPSIQQSSNLVNSQSTMNMAAVQQKQQVQHNRATGVVQPQSQENYHMGPLSLDVAPQQQVIASSVSANSGSSQAQSLLSIGSANSHQLNAHLNNISPCLSQRSCAASHTTSSSGVCCDGDAGSNSNEEIHNHQIAPSADQSSQNNQQSNVTVIAINNRISKSGCVSGVDVNQQDTTTAAATSRQFADEMNKVEEEDGDEDDDLKSSGSGSSSNGLYSLMSEERPLFTGTIVEATSEYQSGDPNHLQMRRGDLIEVLECRPDLLVAGQLPRIANKPMIYGRRLSDGLVGLFPSFCVRRTKNHKQQSLRQRLPMADVSNYQPLASAQNIRGTNIPESFSMATIKNCEDDALKTSTQASFATLKSSHKSGVKSEYRELQVTLRRSDGGFGFVLRGARINPATLTNANGQQNNKPVIDERLMIANNLASLQYLDDIEPNSVAHKAGLRRGDFLVAVNNQDVRLRSHEQVVQMIRQSGPEVLLTIAAPVAQVPHPNYSSKTLVAKVKPEPPKRDPTTTLTRNKTQRANSMVISQTHKQSELFDANKPLPMAPPSMEPQASPTGSLNMMDRSIPTNLAQFRSSAQSLSGSLADSQSISSISTSYTADQRHNQQQSQQATPNHSSSSTTTLTTVATMKPQPPKKPSTIQMNSSQQPVYQPAVITTTTKRSSQPNSSPCDSPKSAQAFAPTNVATPPTTVATPLITPKAISNDVQIVAGAPPPPPPPLPNFSPTQQTNRLFQRRTSAPATPQFTLDCNRLQKKRESLAAVSQMSQLSAPVPAQFGEVAAACAAAANSRLQRQKQQQQQEAEQQQQQQQKQQQRQPQQSTDDELAEPIGSSTPIQRTIETEPVKKDGDFGLKAANESRPPENVANDQVQASTVLQSKVTSTVTTKPTMLERQQQVSATLGRSSAQVIHQTKQQHSQSQTLRTKPKRPAIPNYDELPPPPPPMNVPTQELPQRNSMPPAQSKQVNAVTSCQIHQNHASHHNHQGYPLEDQIYHKHELTNGVKQRSVQSNAPVKMTQATLMQNHQHNAHHHHHHHHRQGHAQAGNQALYQQEVPLIQQATALVCNPQSSQVQNYSAQQVPIYQHHHNHHHHHNPLLASGHPPRDIMIQQQQQHQQQQQAQSLYATQQQQLAKLHQQQLIQQQLRQQYLLQQQQQQQQKQQLQAHYQAQNRACSSSKHAQHDLSGHHNGHHYSGSNDHHTYHHQHQQIHNHPSQSQHMH